MKKALAVFAFCAMGAMAADWTGYIADASCAGKTPDKVASEEHAACAARCIKGGAPAVLVSGGKVYKISNQDKVVAHAGKRVTLSGTLDGDTIMVESVKM
jgi:hypothetical protein